MTDSEKPKGSDHFDSFESDHPRAMTPYEGFGSSSKIAAAKPINPEDPFRNIPRLFPRDASTPRSISEYERQRAERDTDRIAPPDPADITPVERPFEIRVMNEIRELKGEVTELKGEMAELKSEVAVIKQSSQSAAQHMYEMHELVKSIAQSQKRFDLEHKWVPAAAWLITTVIAVTALLRTFH